MAEEREMVFARDNKLHHAARSGDLDEVRRLVEHGGYKVNHFDVETHFPALPIHRAAEGGHFDVVKYLIGKGTDVDARDSSNDTPLRIASLHRDPRMVNFLLEKGADPNIRTHSTTDYTPLGSAAANGNLEVARALARAGAKVNDSSGREGWTPLHSAAWKGDADMVRFLLEAGANPEARDYRGRLPHEVIGQLGVEVPAENRRKTLELLSPQ